MSADRQDLAKEIDRLRRYYAFLFEETPTAITAATVWDLAEDLLCWHVVLHDVLEPDIDVELLTDTIVVRAARGSSPPTLSQAVLPVPAPFDPTRLDIRYQTGAGVLEIRIFRSARP
jgi:hypothetical protein